MVTLSFEVEKETTVAPEMTTVVLDVGNIDESQNSTEVYVEAEDLAQNKSGRIGEAQGLGDGKRCAPGTWDSNERNFGTDCQFICNCDGPCDDNGSCNNRKCPVGWKGMLIN